MYHEGICISVIGWPFTNIRIIKKIKKKYLVCGILVKIIMNNTEYILTLDSRLGL